MEDRRTIRVTGRGTLKLRPDITRLTITLNGHEKEYADTAIQIIDFFLSKGVDINAKGN